MFDWRGAHQRGLRAVLDRMSVAGWWWSGVGLWLFGLGFLPLAAGPTYEYSLLAGVSVPTVTALRAAWVSLHASGSSGPGLFLLRPGVWAGLREGVWAAAVVTLSAAVHAVRAGVCDPMGQWTLVFLGPFAGSLLAAVWGVGSAQLMLSLGEKAATYCGAKRRLRGALLLALTGPVGGIALSVIRYLTSPIIFAFDPFVGFFSGTPYDTVVEGSARLLTYRGSHLLAVAAVVLLLFAPSSTSRAQGQGPGAAPNVAWVGRWGRTLAGALFALAYGWTWLMGPEFGHYQTAASIEATLGERLRSERCEVVFDPALGRRYAARLGRECDGHIAELTALFELPSSGAVRVYLFKDSTQKARLMGARHVYIAKPWRREIYIQAQGFPHPVLGHELAHVVAGEFGQGPLRIAGPFGGLMPDPGRIEGLAVMASPRWDADETAESWAAALLEIGRLPPAGDLFRLSFLGQNAHAAYTVAGAFCDFLRRRYGMAALKAWYGGASVEQAFGRPLEALDGEFREGLRRIRTSEEVLARARARFERPAVFARRCPHQVDAGLEHGARWLGRGRVPQAFAAYSHVLELSPHEFGARVGLARCRASAQDGSAALDAYLELADAAWLDQEQRVVARELLGDQLLASDPLAAHSAYAQALALQPGEDQQRTLTLKQAAARAEPVVREAVVALLVGEPELGTDPLLAGVRLATWAAERRASLPGWIADYLLGRNMLLRERMAEARGFLDRALAAAVHAPNPLFERALLRARVVAGCSDAPADEGARRAALEYLARPEVGLARREGLKHFAIRCGIALAP